MDRSQVIALVQSVAKATDAFERLEQALNGLSRTALSELLLDCGIIPEAFNHDSSEEKLWAKYCDILLAQALRYLGIKSDVIRTRGNAADVLGQCPEYTIVGDAKAFRLSRTAKNQKDFKVSALDAWRRTNTFACLLAPLYQFPQKNSQIYEQAEARNVTLLSYVHLKLLLDYPPVASLSPLWQSPGGLSPSAQADIYWQRIESVLLASINVHESVLAAYKQADVDRRLAIELEEIQYLTSLMSSYQGLTQEQAVQRLIKAEKIEERIQTIQRAIARGTAK